MTAPVLPHADRLTDWEPRLMVEIFPVSRRSGVKRYGAAPTIAPRNADGHWDQRPAVRCGPSNANLTGCAGDLTRLAATPANSQPRVTTPAIPHADRLCVGEAITAPRRRRRRMTGRAESFLAGVVLAGALLAIAI